MAILSGTQWCAQTPRISVSAFLRREFGQLRHGAKIVARLAESPHRTCERWVRGEAEPPATALAEMLTHPRFRETFLAEIDRQRAGGR